MTAKTKTLDDLRAPFPSSVVGLLPKPYKKDSPRSQCNVCNTYHGMPAAHLDFVGHAAVTDRLLTVDPSWTWEPVSFDDRGLPAYDNAGGLWIRLTVLGVTRLGYGDGPDPKQRIGDAIRNAAMRFGVALDLWTKGELESNDPNGGGDVDKTPPASSHGGDVYQHERSAQRTSGDAAEQTAWTEPVRRPPFDLDAWADKVGKATTTAALDSLWDEAKAGSHPDQEAVLRGVLKTRADEIKADALKRQDELAGAKA